MRVTHFNSATFCPFGGAALGGEGPPWRRARWVTHCLLVETERDGLVLVDTGLGTADLAEPAARLGGDFLLTARPRLEPSECAVRVVERLGHRAEDVRHVIVTHLDLDHAGGLGDFSNARLHVLGDELEAARTRRTLLERNRYKPCQWQHHGDIRTYDVSGEPWRGLPAVRVLDGLPPEILLVPLTGHTRGHACVVLETPQQTLVHAGDAFFHRNVLRGEAVPWLARAFERLVAIDRAKLEGNHAQLRALAAEPKTRVFCAHDPVQLDELSGAAQ